MKDEKGFYYHPDPADTETRVYVRKGPEGAEFRLWRKDRPDVWERHEWLSHQVITAAAAMYKERGRATDPLALYDLNVANALLKEAARG
jgi:hypothetical protein